MARQIFTVNATQIVVSESHPEGVMTNVQGYPVSYDSRSYNATAENPNGSEEIALLAAQADYADRVKQLAIAGNRAGWAVSIIRASDGREIAIKSFGGFPDMTPPAPESEQEQEEEEEQ